MAKAKEVVAKEEVKEEVVNETANEVAVKEETAPAEVPAYDLSALGLDMEELEGLTGLDNMNATDFRVPYGKLFSKVTKERKLGDIELPDGTVIHGGEGEVLKGVSILSFQTVRVYFPQPYKAGNTFICRSLDGKKGADEEASAYSGQPCATCEFSKYPEDGGASPCREQVLLLCTTDEVPMFYLLVSGIGVREFKKSFISVEMLKGLNLSKKALGLKKTSSGVLAALNLNVNVEMEDTDNGPFPKMIFRLDRDNPIVGKERFMSNIDSFSSYKTFEKEAVESAATYARTEQSENAEEAQAAGQNGNMF